MANLRKLHEVPFDKRFDTPYGKDQLCHATGYEWYDGEQWWNEYEDANGNLYYGR